MHAAAALVAAETSIHMHPRREPMLMDSHKTSGLKVLAHSVMSQRADSSNSMAPKMMIHLLSVVQIRI
jgi:hypothetical protein